MNKDKKISSDESIKLLARAGLIAALYVVLTVVFAPFGFKEIQVRISEMLTILPFFTVAGIPGITIGCVLGNMLSGAPLPDIIFGSLASFIGAVGTYLIGRMYRKNHPVREEVKIRKLIPATIPPIIANALIIPFVIKYAYGTPMAIWIMMLTIGFGEILSCGVLGTIFGRAISKRKRII